MPMTFAQFRDTRRWSANLARDLENHHWESESEGTPRGYVYLDGLYIDRVEPYWPEKAKAQGQWHLMIGNIARISDDLLSLERDLYDFAVSEGYGQ